jgi:ADP-ribosylglycohydrolase
MVVIHEQHRTTGYSKHMLDALNHGIEAGPRALWQFFDGSFRSQSNGAAMRSAVYGVIRNEDEARFQAELCAQLTHEGFGVEGAEVVALASNYFIYKRGRKQDLNEFLAQKISPIWTTRMRERVAKQNGPITFLTVTAALTAVRESNTLTQVIERSIRVGGDVDTVAAIAMGIAVSCEEIRDDLPKHLWEDAILPVAGLTFERIRDIDQKLAQYVQSELN